MNGFERGGKYVADAIILIRGEEDPRVQELLEKVKQTYQDTPGIGADENRGDLPHGDCPLSLQPNLLS